MKNPIKTLATKALVKMYLKQYEFTNFHRPQYGKADPKWSNWSTENAINEGYKKSIWVYASVDRIAKAAASVPWHVYRQDGKGKWERVEGHPLEQLIERPNPFMSRKDLIERMTVYLNLAGNAPQKKIKAVVGPQAGRTLELWPIAPDIVKPIPDKQKFISGYEVRQDGRYIETIAPENVLHPMFIDPGNPYWGLGPLQVAARTVDTDNEAVNWNKVALQNRAVTDGVFTFENQLHEDEWNEARRQIRTQHQGADNAREPWVLGSGAKWHQMSLSPAEMDFIESRKLTREEIAAIFKVPPPILGIYDKATLANIETARKIFWIDSIIPYLEDLKSTFNVGLTPEFQNEGEILELRYDVSNVEALQENFKEKLDNAKSLWNMGVPLQEVNRRLELGLEEVEGWEVGYLPTSIIPASIAADPGAIMPDEPEPDDPPPDDEDDDEGKPKGGAAAGNKKKADIIYLKAYNGLDLANEEQITAFWKSYERERIPFYARMTNQVNRLFEQQAKKAAKAFVKDGEAGVLEAIENTKADWLKVYRANYLNAIEHFGNRVYTNLMKSDGPEHTKADEETETFDPYDRIISQYLQTVTATKVAYVLDFTKQTIAAIIKDLREDNTPVDQIAKAIRDEIGMFTTHRSFRIARTEIVSASNYGSLEAAKQTGLELKKRWVSSRDSRVRESHEDVDREEVGLEEEFSNGLLHPGDMRPGTPAKEVVHCRCALSYTRKKRPTAA